VNAVMDVVAPAMILVFTAVLQIASSYLLEDENYAGFANQLASIGLKLRDIPGDGLV